MKVAGIIPARYGSTRFPGKALADLLGKPLIQHVVERASRAKLLDDVIVATDDEKIRQAVEAFGGRACLTFSGHPSGTDRVAEVAKTLDCRIVVNIQGDEPLIAPEMIDQAIGPFLKDDSLDMGTLFRRIEDPAEVSNPHVVKVVFSREGYALYFSRSPIPYWRSQESRFAVRGEKSSVFGPQSSVLHRQPSTVNRKPIVYYKHIGLYVYRREFLLKLAALPQTPLERAEELEQLRALEHGFRIKVVETKHDTIGVDTPEDLERVRKLMVHGSQC